MGGWVGRRWSCGVLAVRCLPSNDRQFLYGEVQDVQPRGLVCAWGRGSHLRFWVRELGVLADAVLPHKQYG